MLQMASGWTHPFLKEAVVELTLPRSPIPVWVLIIEITDEFILGLDVLHSCGAFVYQGPHMLQLCQEELSVWSPWAWHWSSCLVALSDHVILA